MTDQKHFHIRTPLIPSPALSKITGKRVYLKMENVQPSGSFKIRGIGATCQDALSHGAKQFVGSSGGNGGMAMAYAAKRLRVPITIFIPESTPKMMIERLKLLEADVRVSGRNWNEANESALTMVSANPDETFFLHPYDQPTTWEGHASIVDEVVEQLKDEYDEKDGPCGMVTCVGGGGLAMGIVKGLQRHGLTTVPVVCMESEGADCFSQAIKDNKVVELPGINSICTSLGARSVLPELLQLVLESTHPLVSHVVTDADAVSACLRFAEDHRVLIEPACGTVLAAAYNKIVGKDSQKILDTDGPLVIIVCGGNIATVDLLLQWKNKFGL